MKPLTNKNSGVLVDKREQLIFEAYKEKHLDSSVAFKKEIHKNYGFTPSSLLYAKIINYQIEKYGNSLTSSNVIERTNNFRSNNKNYREKRKKCNAKRSETERFIRRIEHDNK